ncbi:S-adenosylmethionine hydrolase [Halolamina salifodinae]|uniref:S-adenosylmethionine hydrolase n=2 Tax=Halolamina salifodinae TaxID=1202767 RepID=A0A8T4GX39_9EURY|nr:S-adenosylmethionine hydrolase [Halolamina salifodinae]
MKGVILRQTDARLVDIAHDFPRQDVRAAAFWLREVLPEFPAATHLVVVDPGVGTDRAAIVVEVAGHRIVAPDNGVALPAARRLKERADGETEIQVYDIAYDDDTTASNTFHGRDVFAPAAARVHEADAVADASGISATDEWVDLQFPDPVFDEDSATGEVLVVDDFGNTITNIPGHVLDDRQRVTVNGESAPVRDAYAQMDSGERLVTVGSHGNVEFAVNQGRGDEAFDLSVGDSVSLTW